MKKLLCVALLSFTNFNPILWSQMQDTEIDQTSTLVGMSFDYAYILKHSENLRELDDAFPVGIGLELSKMLLTRKAWEFCNCLPRVGVEMAYWSWDNPDILGDGLLAMGFVEPYFRTHKSINLFFRAGLGGAYLSNPFDVEQNPQNLSYSTDLSFAITVGAGINYRLTDEWNIGLLAKYNHTSNGGIKAPNKGINFPSLSFRINKSLEPIVFPDFQKVENRKPPDKLSRISLTHFSGWSNATVGDRDKFYVFGVAGQYSKWIGKRSAISAGTELIFDYSRREQIRLNEQNNNFVQAAALVGHEFWLGKVTFSQQIGVYYFNDYRINDDVYQRYGLSYNFSKQIYGGFNLKAHRHVADFFDLRIGYTF
ncbi:acyloxyacyl hydrolase [Psychroflexus montanilacus]|uniref:acyloxyacyl hydrolase n=1 Tax=Psychroflexus montanilacus TaxID=2873598 RepID=UPI001CD00F3A|nr:acyloxyacyl hydrolase [Psychroflexus montanilacus]MBZ9651070.1 acyloxyacyl hydrolase [Psychroflexus montanilacus]